MRNSLLVIVINLLGLWFLSCSKKGTNVEKEKNLLLDSSVSIGSVDNGYKFIYNNDKITEVKRYYLNDPTYPEKYIGKIEYVYENSRIAAKKRYFFPSGNDVTEIQYFRYDANGQLSQIERYRPSNGLSQIIDLQFEGNKLMKAKMFGDSIVFQYDSNGNIKKAFNQGREYDYITTNKPNPFLKNQLFINDYNLSNFLLYSSDLRHFPVYFNKFTVLEFRNVFTYLYPDFRFEIETNPEGYLKKYKVTKIEDRYGTQYSYWYAEYYSFYK